MEKIIQITDDEGHGDNDFHRRTNANADKVCYDGKSHSHYSMKSSSFSSQKSASSKKPNLLRKLFRKKTSTHHTKKDQKHKDKHAPFTTTTIISISKKKRVKQPSSGAIVTPSATTTSCSHDVQNENLISSLSSSNMYSCETSSSFPSFPSKDSEEPSSGKKEGGTKGREKSDILQQHDKSYEKIKKNKKYYTLNFLRKKKNTRRGKKKKERCKNAFTKVERESSTNVIETSVDLHILLSDLTHLQRKEEVACNLVDDIHNVDEDDNDMSSYGSGVDDEYDDEGSSYGSDVDGDDDDSSDYDGDERLSESGSESFDSESNSAISHSSSSSESSDSHNEIDDLDCSVSDGSRSSYCSHAGKGFRENVVKDSITHTAREHNYQPSSTHTMLLQKQQKSNMNDTPTIRSTTSVRNVHEISKDQKRNKKRRGPSSMITSFCLKNEKDDNLSTELSKSPMASPALSKTMFWFLDNVCV